MNPFYSKHNCTHLSFGCNTLPHHKGHSIISHLAPHAYLPKACVIGKKVSIKAMYHSNPFNKWLYSGKGGGLCTLVPRGQPFPSELCAIYASAGPAPMRLHHSSLAYLSGNGWVEDLHWALMLLVKGEKRIDYYFYATQNEVQVEWSLLFQK